MILCQGVEISLLKQRKGYVWVKGFLLRVQFRA